MVHRIIMKFGSNISTIKKVRHYRKKIKNFNKTLDKLGFPELDGPSKQKIKEFYARFEIKPRTYWHRFYTWGWGKFEPSFIPEDFYYSRLEMAKSHSYLKKAYVDKNNYGRLFGIENLPYVLLRKENGEFANSKYEHLTKIQAIDTIKSYESELVIKPSLITGGGREILVGSVKGDSFISGSTKYPLKKLLLGLNNDIIIEKFIDQHPAMKRLHPESVNTVKVMTVRTSGQIRILSSFVRMGHGVSRIDNLTGGGLAVGIDEKGIMREKSLQESFERLFSHPDSGMVFSGYVIPNYTDLINLCKMLHGKLRYFKFATWDMAIERERGPIMIEVNIYGQDINYHQVLNGPLFGNNTQKIINECLTPF